MKIINAKIIFLRDDGTQSGAKTYDFLISSDLYFDHLEDFKSKPFRLVNQNGYDYRGSFVQMVGSAIYEGNGDRGLTEILQVSFAAPETFRSTIKIDSENFIHAIEDDSSFEPSSNTFIMKLKNPSLTTATCTCAYTDTREKEIQELKNGIVELNAKIAAKEKENNKMGKFGLNINFGKANSNEIRMSMYGPAFHSKDGWFAFDGENYIDVSNFLFDGENYCYMMPCAEDNLSLGDYIYHVDGWCRVVDVDNMGRVEVERINDRTIVKIAPSKNVFGFNFFTKLVSMFGNNEDSFGLGEDNPFGNMLPFMLMSEGNDNKDTLFAMMCMNGMQNGNNNMLPFLLMSMSSEKGSNMDNMAFMMMMSQMNGQFGKKKEINKN